MIEIQLRDASNNKIGPGPLTTVTRWRHVRRLDAVGEISFELPATDLRSHANHSDGNPAIHPKRYAYAYGLRGGLMVQIGAGIVEESDITLSGRGVPTMQVSGGDLLSELRRTTCYSNASGDASYQLSAVNDAPDTILTAFASSSFLPGSWSLSGSDTVMDFYGKFIHETVLNALRAIADATGEHFRLGDNGREVEWLGAAGDFVDCGVRAETDVDPIEAEDNDAICLITNVRRRKDGRNLYNMFYPSGAGQGLDRLTLEWMTHWPDGHRLVSNITSISRTGSTVTVVTSTAHELSDADEVEIKGTENFDGVSGAISLTGASSFTYTEAGSAVSETNTGVVIGPNARTIDGRLWLLDRQANGFYNQDSRTAYGNFQKALTFKDIAPLSNSSTDLAAASNALARAIYNYAIKHEEPARFYDLSVAKLSQTVYPGETIRVVCRRFITEANDATGVETTGVWLDINEDLYILETVEEHGPDGAEVVGMTVATVDRFPEDGVSTVLDAVQTLVEAGIHPQPGVSIDTVSREQVIDEDVDFETRFRLPNYIQRVELCTLWFRVDQLISPVKSVGGSASVNVSIPNHAHTIPVNAGSGGAGTTVEVIDVGGTWYFIADTGVTRYIDTQAGTGAATGTVDLSSAITTVYGAFKEAALNTYAYTEIDITINGASPTNSVVSEGSGWYSLDLLPDVASEFNGTPFQVFNEVVFSPNTTGKTANIYAEFEIRAIVQSLG